MPTLNAIPALPLGAAATLLRPTAARPILIVDDDLDLLEALADLLLDEGLPVVAARTGAEAVFAACAHAPSLVLLDDRLGGERAPLVARQLRERAGARLPIVLLSGEADLAAVAREAGVVDSLAKPFSVAALLGCVHRHRAP